MKTKITIIGMIIIATIITSYSAVGTYAKYTTKVEDSSTARVAKWGFSMTKVDLFTDSTIKTSNGKNIIAPGTEGSYQFKIEGKPETSYNLIVNLEDKTSENMKGRIEYCFDGKDCTTDIMGLMVPIRDAYDSDTVYEPNTDAGLDYWTGDENIHTISWKWLFDDGTDVNGTSLDILDTAVGKIAIVNPDGTENANPPQVKFTVKVRAEQVD